MSPLKKTVKFNSALAQFCEDEEDDVDLLALLEDFDHSELKSASPRPVALTQTVLTNESFDSGILFSGNDSLFDTSFNESPAIQTINPGFSAEVSKNVPKIDDQIEDDEILSLSSMLPADSAVLKSNYVPQLITPESFSLKQLEYNIKNINPSLALNSLSSLFTVDDPPRRLKGPAALMAQKIRKIGPATQITFIDGTGTEILGTLCNTDCKVHYGMIFILQDVRLFLAMFLTKVLSLGLCLQSYSWCEILEHYCK